MGWFIDWYYMVFVINRKHLTFNCCVGKERLYAHYSQPLPARWNHLTHALTDGITRHICFVRFTHSDSASDKIRQMFIVGKVWTVTDFLQCWCFVNDGVEKHPRLRSVFFSALDFVSWRLQSTLNVSYNTDTHSTLQTHHHFFHLLPYFHSHCSSVINTAI